jgi:hypothetical protein
LFRDCIEATWGGGVAQGSFFVYEGRQLPSAIATVWNRLIFTKRGKVFWRRRINVIPVAKYKTDSRIEVPVWDTWDNLTVKFLSAARLLLETNDFDYLIRVNTTTFVNLDKIEDLLSSGSEYIGFEPKKEFATGWAIVMSRNLVHSLCNSKNFPLDVQRKNDDRLIGDLASHHGYSLSIKPSVTIDSKSQLESKVDNSFPFIRIKSKHNRLTHDPILFREVVRILNSD